jgi:hypothetical protein
MRTRVRGRITLIAALAAVTIAGCQSGDSRGARSRETGASTTGEALAKASEVTVTYYYLPG